MTSSKKNKSKKKTPGAEPKRPEWTPDSGGPEFASRVQPGVAGGHDGLPRPDQTTPKAAAQPSRKPSGKKLTVDEYVEGILKGDRTILGRAITLVESNARAHVRQAQQMLKQLMPHTGRSIRIGITGVPGAGKSTLIEALGLYLIEQGHRVAVLAIDPSSSITRGSILGDKTRMEALARRPESFIRPSPSGGALGGVARKTRETMLVCEAAGFDVILVETVGVGQSEITVRSMVDFFLLLQIAGGGDELQGIKKGVIELADAIFINKADGANKAAAEAARQELETALHYLTPTIRNWQTRVFTCSALTGEGIDTIWKVVQKFVEITRSLGVFEEQRQRQALEWMHALLNEHLQRIFHQHPDIQRILPEVEFEVARGKTPPTAAAEALIQIFRSKLNFDKSRDDS